MTDIGELIRIVELQLEGAEGSRLVSNIVKPSTLLIGDLGLSSVEFVVIFEKIQRSMGVRLNFIDLIMPDRSSYVDDLSVEQIYKFVSRSSESVTDLSVVDDPYARKREPISLAEIERLDASVRHQLYAREVVSTSYRLCFVLSAPRSGSTLLRSMLGCHHDIYAPMELHLMSYTDFAQRQEELLDPEHRHLLEGTIVARQEVRGLTREVSTAVDSMYSRDGRSVTQFYRELSPYIKEKVLVDKTPTYSFSSATLQRLKDVFPEALFIHLTRKPNAVIKSMIDSGLGELIRFSKTSQVSSGQFPEALWCLCEQNIRAVFPINDQRIIRVGFEELVEYPVETMARIHEFLGVTSSKDIDPYKASLWNSEERPGSYAGDLKTFLRNKIDSSVAREWEGFESLCWLSEPTSSLIHST